MSTTESRPGPGRVGGHRVGQVAGRGAGRHLEPELARLGQGDRDHPVLERAGRVGRVVLDPQLAQAELGGQAVGPHQRGEAGAEVDGRLVVDGQQVPVAPDGAGPRRDALPADRGGDRLVVVGHLERPEAVVADVQGLGRELPRTLTTAQPSDEIDHGSSSSIGHWHQVRPRQGKHWLPRRQRARPSVALDDGHHGSRPGRGRLNAPGCLNLMRGAHLPPRGLPDPTSVLEAKARTGRSVSVCIPARDEGSTVGSVVRAVVQPFLIGHGGNGLVDEVIVLDDGSVDDTAAQARDAGRPGRGRSGRTGRQGAGHGGRPRRRRRATSWSSSMPTWPTPRPPSSPACSARCSSPTTSRW